MKKSFKNIDELHAYLEKQASRIIKSYYSDWKNYDRPEVMMHTGLKTKEVYIILREAGSYLYSRSELTDPGRNYPAAVMDYYKSYGSAHYYKVNFDRLTVETIPAGLPKDIETERREALKESGREAA